MERSPTGIDTSDNYECGDLVDLEGKGKATAILTHTRQTVWFEVGVKDGKPDKTIEWKRYTISFDEGIGAGLAVWAGDLRGSGRIVVVVTGKFGGPVWFENKGK